MLCRPPWRSCGHLAAWLLYALLAGCGQPSPLGKGVTALPEELRELSGMVMVEQGLLACVQDELGGVFFVDLSGARPTRGEAFGAAGDYEGIASTPDGLWVLRSDGALLRLTAGAHNLSVRDTYMMPFEGEFEGLCFDARANRLLVLPKGAIEGRRRERHRRRILGFDLAKMAPLSEPILTLKVDDVEEQIGELGLDAPRHKTKKGKQRVKLSLLGSELLVLPGGDLLLLLSKDQMLLRVDAKGDVVATTLLDAELLAQPESMALMPDGRLLVGSEGRQRSALVAVVEIPKAAGG